MTDDGAHAGKGRQPPVKIPLPFEKAVEGLLGVRPEKPAPVPPMPVEKKPTRTKKPRQK